MKYCKRKTGVFCLDEKEKSSIALATVYFYFEASTKKNNFIADISSYKGCLKNLSLAS